MALVGGLDADHHALLQQTTGGLRLVLHHEGNCAKHHHGAVAKALAVFAQPASETDPDHVVQFGTSDGFLRCAPPIDVSENTHELQVISPTENSFPTISRPIDPLPPPSPPPDVAGNLLGLRSTVILI